MFEKLKRIFKKPVVQPVPLVSQVEVAPVVSRGYVPVPEGGPEVDFELIFEPLVTFEWRQGEHLIAQYVPGCTYNCTRFPVHAALRQKVVQWVQEGKIAIVPLAGMQKFVMTSPE